MNEPNIGKIVELIRNEGPNWSDPFKDHRSSPYNLITQLKRPHEVGKKQLLEIARIKSPRRIGDAERNSDDFVKRTTRLALDTKTVVDEEVRIQILTALHGVRVPTASAILAWTHPEAWAVIDQRAWRALAHFNLVEAEHATQLTAHHWAVYLRFVRHLSKETDWIPQRIDRWLYAFEKIKLQGANSP